MGKLLREVKPDLILLQEVNLGSAETLRQAAGADWLICAAQLRQRAADGRPVRSRGVAIAGRGPAPQGAWIPDGVPLPERILPTGTTVEGLGLTALSDHAPPGVSELGNHQAAPSVPHLCQAASGPAGDRSCWVPMPIPR